jgi:hypothetical protein
VDEHRDFLLKTGLKSDFGPVEPDLSVTKSNWRYAVPSDTENWPAAPWTNGNTKKGRMV